MKTIYLLRHAKSSWDDPSLQDFDRPLSARGRQAAPQVGQFMRDQGWIPNLVLCSAAQRTRETWKLVSSRLGSEPEVRFQRGLYMAGTAELLMEIHVQMDSADSLLLLGHNPGMQDLARYLAGSGDPRDLERMDLKFPTAALAVLRSRSDRWAGVTRGSCTLERFIRPKDLDF